MVPSSGQWCTKRTVMHAFQLFPDRPVQERDRGLARGWRPCLRLAGHCGAEHAANPRLGPGSSSRVPLPAPCPWRARGAGPNRALIGDPEKVHGPSPGEGNAGGWDSPKAGSHSRKRAPRMPSSTEVAMDHRRRHRRPDPGAGAGPAQHPGPTSTKTAPELKPIGAELNLLPQAVAELRRARPIAGARGAGRDHQGSRFFDGRFGRLIHREPGAAAAADNGAADFADKVAIRQAVLLDVAEQQPLGAERLRSVGPAPGQATLVKRSGRVRDTTGAPLPGPGRQPADPPATAFIRASAASSTRRRANPSIPASTCGAGSRAGRVLTGASMVRAGWLGTGKMVIYPSRTIKMAASSSTGWPNSKRRAIGAGTGTVQAGLTIHCGLRRLVLRLARRSGNGPRRAIDPRISHG